MTDEELKTLVEREGLPFAYVQRCDDPKEGLVVFVHSRDRPKMWRAYHSITRAIPKTPVCISEFY